MNTVKPAAFNKDAGRESLAGASNRLLFVTMFPNRFEQLARDAEIVGSAKAGLEAARLRRFRAVFADMGPLPGGENGFRFVRALRSQLGVQCPIYLMSDELLDYNNVYAHRIGANGLVLRTAAAVVQTMEAGASRMLAQYAATVKSRPAVAPTGVVDAAILDSMSVALRKHIGPIADSLARAALLQLGRRHAAGVPAAILARQLAEHIEEESQREKFLRMFIVNGAA